MFRPFTFFTILCLFLWLLPLGTFIKPSQEKTACDGRRAFHMCSMMSGKVRTEASSKISFTNASGVEKTAKSSGAGGDDFLISEINAGFFRQSSKRVEPVFLDPLQVFPRSVFHPPITDPLF